MTTVNVVCDGHILRLEDNRTKQTQLHLHVYGWCLSFALNYHIHIAKQPILRFKDWLQRSWTGTSIHVNR